MASHESGAGAAATGDDVVDVVVTDEIDLATYRSYETMLFDAIDSGAREVRVDLSGVAFFGSEGVRGLVAAQERAQARGVELRIVQVSPIAGRMLEISGLLHLLARPSV